MTALIIILSIIAFFVLLFLIRVRVCIKLHDSVFELAIMVFGIKIKILPKKPKKYNLKKYTLKKIRKRDEKARIKEEKKAQAKKEKQKAKAEKKKQAAALTKAEKKAIKAKKKAAMPKIPDMISLFKEVLGIFFTRFFAKFHFHVAKIIIKVGSNDACTTATLYGAICAALGPALTFIDRHSNLHTKKNFQIYISPDFTSEKLDIDIDLGFSMSLSGILSAVFKAGFKFLFGWISIKPTPENEEQNKDENKTEEKAEINKENQIISSNENSEHNN